MSVFDALLHVQEHDTTIDQIEHRLAHLPERQAVEVEVAALAAVGDEAATVQNERDAVAKEQKRLEDEAASVEAHAEDIHGKLYGGTITSPKELQGFQAEHDSLKKRQAHLEDLVIEQMELGEPLDEQLAEIADRRSAIEARHTAAVAALTAAEEATRAELAAARAEREPIAAQVSPEQLARYEKLRPLYQGVAVAKLVGTNCSGCHLTLSSVTLDRIRKLPEDALVECDECGRILVR